METEMLDLNQKYQVTPDAHIVHVTAGRMPPAPVPVPTTVEKHDEPVTPPDDHDAPSASAAASSNHHPGWLARLRRRFPILQNNVAAAVVAALCLLPLLGLLGLLALNRGRPSSSSPAGDAGLIRDDAYFYGQSEPVYPAPAASGNGGWADAHQRAAAFVAQLTLDEKVGLASGAVSTTPANGCSGNLAAIPRLNFSGLCLTDAGQGVRATDLASGFPSGLHSGASWNRALTRARGQRMGAEFRAKGAHVLLGPVVGPLGRFATGGRNWEGFAADPYLSGALAAETVRGVQGEGVVACVKHFVGNEQESYRNPTTAADGSSVASVSANVGDRAMHELYLWPFADAVRAGAGAVMCAYNRVNNSYACANSKAQNGLLKAELAFPGAVVTDWGALRAGAGVAAALAGADVAMPSAPGLWGDNLAAAVRNGSVPGDRLDDMAARVVAAHYQMGQDRPDSGFPAGGPGVGMPPDLTRPHAVVDARNASAEARQVLFDGAVEGHVLLKNTNSGNGNGSNGSSSSALGLPLRQPRMLSVFGYSARSPDQWNYAAGGGVAAWTFGGESDYLGRDTSAGFAGEIDPDFSRIAPNGTLFGGGGSGAVTPALPVSPYDALARRAADDGTAVAWDLASPTPDVAAASDACLVLGNAFASEGFDRPGLQDDFTDGLIRHVADRCANTIVVLHNAGARLVDGWVEHANVTALVFAHLPGEQSGPALAALLHGDAGADLTLLDYRYFDAAAAANASTSTPRFEFGFGMSYTTFAYSGLRISRNDSSNDSSSAADAYPVGNVVPGGPADLWDVLATVSAEVANTGDVAGAEVAQLYVGIPNAPIRQLRGFEKLPLEAGQSGTASFPLTRRDLSIWDVVAQKWLLQRGTYNVSVGASSRDLPLQGSLTF
ncbi:glycosyl hydrolase family 3 N terminal domain-containing protein [Xylariaceae sp. FL0804]|nr:glycosyl hydrolase family 3 N terminal domain-containing protein [Xylariaceae sp. FL0804]